MTTPRSGPPGDDASGRTAPYAIIPRQKLLHHSEGHDLTGAAAFYLETERLEEMLVNQARIEASNLGVEISPETAAADIDAILHKFLAAHKATRADFFAVAEIYDADHKPIGEANVQNFGFLEDHFDRRDHLFPALGNSWYQKLFVSGTPYLQVMVPLASVDGQLTGWFEGIYRLSPESLADIRLNITLTTGLAVVAVLLTAAVLYPLMASLQRQVVATAQNLLHANIDTLKVLGSAIAKRDSDTNAHNFRVTFYSVRIAEALELDATAIRRLIKGSFLHDVGKIAIADAILLKPGRLDDKELAEMRTHVAHGLDIIAACPWLADAADVVGGHHEKFDGSGYPQALAGEAIPLAARIFAVADVFDALTSERPYKPRMPVEQALSIMENGCGTHFDVRVFETFRTMIEDLHRQIYTKGESEVERLAEEFVYRYFGILEPA